MKKPTKKKWSMKPAGKKEAKKAKAPGRPGITPQAPSGGTPGQV